MLNKVVFLLGVKIQDTQEAQQEHVANMLALSAYLQNEFPNVTLEEIEAAYTMGVKGELLEFFNGEMVPLKVFPLLNPLQVSVVLSSYMRHKKGQLSVVAISKFIEQKTERVPTEEEMEQEYLKILKKAFEAVERGEAYQDWGNVLYDALDARGLIHFSKEEKWQFVEMAKNEQYREAQQKTNENLHTVFYRAAERAVAALRGGEYNETDVKIRAKTLALNALIYECIETEWTAEELWASSNKI